jgi:hypothetical protein
MPKQRPVLSGVVMGIALVLALTALPLGRAFGADLLGFYVGGAAGESQVEADAAGITAGNFKQDHTAWALMAGIRPISPVGAELDYINFGHPTGNLGGQPADASMKGAAAFGLLYLPLPLPILDVYAKAGLARLQSTVNGGQLLTGVGSCSINQPNCNVQLFRLDRTDTRFAGGVGAQLKFGDWAVRAEYERFDAAGGNPGLFTLGVTLTIL